MKDAKAAAKFKGTLEATKLDGARSQKVVESPDDPWLTWQVRGDVAMLRGWLSVGGKK